MEGPLPVLHFCNQTTINGFNNMLKSKFISMKALSNFGVTHDAVKDTEIHIYSWERKRFGCLVTIMGDMCESTQILNQMCEGASIKTIYSIDPTGDHSRGSRHPHSSNCQYIRSGEALFEYFELQNYENTDKANEIREWIGNHDDRTPQSILVPLSQLFRHIMNNDDDWANHAQPKEKKVKLDSEWNSKLTVAEKRVQTNDSNKQCSICLDFEKTIVFVPCGHWCCDSCFENIMIEPTLQKACPYCKSEFDTIVKPID